MEIGKLKNCVLGLKVRFLRTILRRKTPDERTYDEITLEMTTSKRREEFDRLLSDAVRYRSCRVVKSLLEFNALKNFVGDSTSVDGLVMAAKSGNEEIIDAFLTFGFNSIPDEHRLDCACIVCKNDRLGQAKRRMRVLEAKSGGVWMAKTCANPFANAFELYATCRRLAIDEDSFEKDYAELVKKLKTFCLALLDEIENEEEVNILMQYGYLGRELSFMNTAVEYDHKDIVAHPISQHFIWSKVFGELPLWREHGLVFRMFFIVVMACLVPVTSLAYIVWPGSRLGKLAKNPIVKFISSAVSFVMFLALLAAISMAEQPSGLQTGKIPNAEQVLVFLWTVGLFVQEVRQIWYQGKRRYFSSVWNWIDVGMILLLLSSYVIWTLTQFVLYPNTLSTNVAANDLKTYKFLISAGDGFFAMAMVLSFFRMVYLCQITRFLGLLQLCLGKMLQVIFQFAFISCVVLWSFSVAMMFLYHNSNITQQQHANATEISRVVQGSYDGLAAAMVTLAWASMNLAGLETLHAFDDGTMIQLWSYFLFTFYHGVTMIVLLNMLIAMMSNSYQQIENNIEVELKFARTTLWLEYIGGINNLPVPFNLLPSVNALKQSGVAFRDALWGRKKKNDMMVLSREKCQKKFSELCKKLSLRYLEKVKSSKIIEPTPPTGFLLKVQKSIAQWTRTKEDTPEKHVNGETRLAVDNGGYSDERKMQDI